MNTDSFNVKVTNKNDFDIEDRFDGIPYRMPAKKAVNIPYEAACHIFGVDFLPDDSAAIDLDAIYRHLQRRWGWNLPRDKDAPASKDPRAIFDNMEFKVVALSLVEKDVSTGTKPMPDPRESREGEISRGVRAFAPKPKIETNVEKKDGEVG